MEESRSYLFIFGVFSQDHDENDNDENDDDDEDNDDNANVFCTL